MDTSSLPFLFLSTVSLQQWKYGSHHLLLFYIIVHHTIYTVSGFRTVNQFYMRNTLQKRTVICMVPFRFTFICPLISKITYIRTLSHYTFIELFDIFEWVGRAASSSRGRGASASECPLTSALIFPRMPFWDFSRSLPLPKAAQWANTQNVVKVYTSQWGYALGKPGHCTCCQLCGEAEGHVFVSQEPDKMWFAREGMANHTVLAKNPVNTLKRQKDLTPEDETHLKFSGVQ